MSGLCGVVHLDGEAASAAEVRAMADAGRHRGPDGIDVEVRAEYGMARLACALTPAPADRQPVTAQDGRYVLVADARIDNRDEVRAALGRDRCESEDGAGDAALLLAAFIAWDRECCARLVGDYAFVVWDRRQRRLFAARDPMAMRPLYVAADAHRCYFASEIGQILATGRVATALSAPMAAAWLASRGGRPEWTFFRDVTRVPGAHAFEVQGGQRRLRRVWDVDPEKRIRYRRSGDYVEHFRGLMLDATRCRLDGSDRAGMLLSGGLDSCVVGAAAGAVMTRSADTPAPADFTTIAFRYEGFPECDERHISQPLAEHWGMAVREVSSDVWSRSHLVGGDWGLDSPAVAMYRPMHDAALDLATELGIRRLLMAVRGDNMMGGTVLDAAGLIAARQPAAARRELAAIGQAYGTGALRTFRRHVLRPWRFALSRRLPAGMLRPELARPRADASSRNVAHEYPWLGSALLATVSDEDLYRPATPPRFRSLANMKRWELVFDRFGELGHDERERQAAARGIRYEDPWSDRRILEFVVAVPQFVLNRIGHPKQLSRRMLEGMAPPAVQQGARKIFPAAFGTHALRRIEGDALLELTTDMKLGRAGWVDQSVLAAGVRTFLAGGDFPEGLWPAVTLEAWLRHHGFDP